MKNTDSPGNTSYSAPGVGTAIYYRLIALWVLNEAMLGGIIHGLKIPVSGLIVGSCAVVCISLIAWYVPKKGAIIKATIIVAVFKMMLSPQAPPPAYLAVFFQGLLGELLFWNRRFFKLSCLLIAVLALLESGLQRILVLTIIYGNDLWKVINDFINGLTKQKISTNYSFIIGAAYVAMHVIAGLFAGWLSSLLPGKIAEWDKTGKNRIDIVNNTVLPARPPSKKRKRLKKGLLVTWIILVSLYVQSYFEIGTPLLPSHVSLKILLRSVIIVLSWVFIAGPLLRQLLHYWLQRKQTQSQQDIQIVLQLLPSTERLIAECWRRTAGRKGWMRIKECCKMILVNLGPAQTPPSPVKGTRAEVYILTGPVRSGKTTSLIQWAEKRRDVYGILTPVVNGKRMFVDAHTHGLFDMEASPDETDVLRVGRYAFSKKSFNRAVEIIRETKDKVGFLVIDEIGPLELGGGGFYEIIKEVTAAKNISQQKIFVAREGLAEKVKELFLLNDAVIINDFSVID